MPCNTDTGAGMHTENHQCCRTLGDRFNCHLLMLLYEKRFMETMYEKWFMETMPSRISSLGT